eukprot:6455402-Amphidinium_carterae.1
MTVPRSKRLQVSKRDARRYFHVLRVGEKWKRFLAQPRLRVGSRRALHRAWPMGFAGSVSFAQGITNASAARAQLPSSRRCVPGQRMPLEPPVRGAIIDDMW